MRNYRCISAIVLATALVAGPAIAQSDTVAPQILTLSDRAEAVLPGDQSGANHGVKVNRGSGFPEPVIAIIEPEEVVVEPAPEPRRRFVSHASRW